MIDQKVSGSDNTVSGRDNNVTNHFFGASTSDQVRDQFDRLNEKVRKTLGRVTVTTNDTIDFDSEKLFASLVYIGIPPWVSLVIALNLFPYIEEAIEVEGEQFSTAHIRKAVSYAILHMTELSLSRSQRQELAAKYARNYGNPGHIHMVVLQDGVTQPINYRYLVETFLPELVRKLTGAKVTLSGVVSRNNFEHMANEIIETVRRLGIYHIRYETILALAEDLATQLPHPWFPIERNQKKVIEHDKQRVEHHLSIVFDDQSTDVEFWRSAYECFNHACSLILANYRCPIGGGTHAPSNTLRNITRLRADGEHQNLALWDFCDISDLEDDLIARGMDAVRFHSEIKGLQKSIDRMRPDKIAFVRSHLAALADLALAIQERE